MTFAKPAAASSGFDYNDIKGSLLVVEAHSIESAVPTKFGDKDAVRATITIVDGDSAGDVHADTLIFGKALIQQLRPNVGQKTVGRLIQGVATGGNNPPWKLDDPTPADMAAAEKYFDDVEAPF